MIQDPYCSRGLARKYSLNTDNKSENLGFHSSIFEEQVGPRLVLEKKDKWLVDRRVQSWEAS